MTKTFAALRRLFTVAGVAIAGAAALPHGAAAQFDGFPEEVSSYRLTVDGLHKFVQATANLEALDENEDWENPLENVDPDDLDFDQMVAAMDSHPQVRAALRDAGMDSREFFTFVISMMQAMFGSIAVQMGGDDALAEMEDGVLKDNIRFVIDHRDELEALGGGDDEDVEYDDDDGR